MMTTFTTMTDAISYVEQALGEFVEDYDVEAIAGEVTDWEGGRLTLTADGDDFWEVVSRHDRSAE